MSAGFDPILFDLDGTIVDSVALIRESYRHAVREVLGREVPEDDLVRQVGRPLDVQMRLESPEQQAALVHTYREWNRARAPEYLRLFPGVEEMLERLRAAGRTVGVVTSKSGPMLDEAFEVLSVRQYFMIVVAADDTRNHKPHPEPITTALTRLGRRADGACYVGDGRVDIEAAVAAGVTPIGVTWGFSDRDTLLGAGATLVADDPLELARELLGG